MKCIGVDPSSSCSGVALADGNEILWATNWKPNKAMSASTRLYAYYTWLCETLIEEPAIGKMLNSGKKHADMACVEFLSVERNAQTARVVSHYQAASVLACKSVGMIVVESRVSSARKIVLGNGSLSKDDAWDIMRHKHDFSKKTVGGTDEMDAAVLALAGPTVAEMSRR